MKLEGRSERPYGRLLQNIVEQRFAEFVTRGVERMPSCAEQRMLRSQSSFRSSAPLSTAIAHQHRERPQPVGSRQCAVGSSTYCEPPTAYCAIAPASRSWLLWSKQPDPEGTRRYRQCNYDLERRTIRFIPAKCCPREGGTPPNSQAWISQCASSGISVQPGP
jgi:hypothetical protein